MSHYNYCKVYLCLKQWISLFSLNFILISPDSWGWLTARSSAEFQPYYYLNVLADWFWRSYYWFTIAVLFISNVWTYRVNNIVSEHQRNMILDQWAHTECIHGPRSIFGCGNVRRKIMDVIRHTFKLNIHTTLSLPVMHTHMMDHRVCMCKL